MIKDKNLNLRAVERKDIKLLWQWDNDPELQKLVGPSMPVSFEEKEKWFDDLVKKPERHVLMIDLTKEKRAIGYIYLDFDWINNKVELSICIGEKEVWDRGYGQEAVELVQAHCFENLKINKMNLRVLDFNERAIRLYEKCGFSKEGLITFDYLINGDYHHRYMMGISREQYLARKATK